MSIFGFSDYRAYLRAILAERAGKNRAYSLRAMAKALGLAPSSLSEMLKGKKNLAASTALDVAERLGLTGSEAEYFVLMTQLGTARKQEVRQKVMYRLQALNSQQPVHDLSVDVFTAISEWYHLPILEMTYLSGAKLTANLASSRLGISIHQAQAAIDRLLRLELLARDERTGELMKAPDRWITSSEAGHRGLRAFHREMLAKAASALETQDNREKFVGSETFALDPAQLPAAREILEEAFQKIVALAGSGKARSDVYHLGIQLFNLTPEKKRTQRQ